MFDLTPLNRSTIGFDSLASMFDSITEANTGYPPYNIERISDDTYQIVMAVAGFSENELEIETEKNILKISGRKTLNGNDEKRHFLHQGIATRSFKRQFQLADFVEVTDAGIKDGLLHIKLKREIPEEMKTRKVKIQSGTKFLTQ